MGGNVVSVVPKCPVNVEGPALLAMSQTVALDIQGNGGRIPELEFPQKKIKEPREKVGNYASLGII